MTNQQDDLLVKELGKVGELGGRIGGGAAGAIGGAMGAKFAAKFLPTEQHRHEMTVGRDVAAVLTAVTSFLAKEGRIADDAEAGTSTCPKISAILKSGFLQMNPTLVHVEVIAAEANACTLLVSAAAKEGLIKQHSAEKAVRRVVAFLETLG
ncbi:MAG: hypothetical protein JW818_23410 [Pirellulales bacterium]|nr:hypothetical protein [Pirellulales bacterium]